MSLRMPLLKTNLNRNRLQKGRPNDVKDNNDHDIVLKPDKIN